MSRRSDRPMLPGASVLGGAACGLSYEGLLRDAMAQEERHRRREMGRSRETPRSQVQAGKADPGHAEQARIAGR